jgi:uncharacterized membrane protein YgdD (TMEM256/DUF423 family)
MSPEIDPKFHWRSRSAALLGLLAVALGAVGAHAFKATLSLTEEGPERWRTASFYHLTHAIVLFFTTAARWKAAWWSWFFGILFFCGSLYALALTGIKTFAHTAPIGGVLLMFGWAFLIYRPKP